MNGNQTVVAPKDFEVCASVLEQGLAQLSIDLTARQLQQFWQYASLMHAWAKVVNITAITSPQHIVTHHLLDCLAALPVADAVAASCGHRMLDVGAGAGLPGLVWAIARPHWHITLLDAVQKKVAFMQQAIANLALANVHVVHGRVEQLTCAVLGLPAFGVVTSRAFASMGQFAECSGHLLAQDGCLLALKGRADREEPLPSAWQVRSVQKLTVPFLNEERHVFCIQRYNGTLV